MTQTNKEIAGKPQVSLSECLSYTAMDIERAMEEVVAPFGGIKSMIRPGDKVLIKLNLLMPATPDQGVTTHPQMAETLARMILDCGGHPIFSDSGAVRNWEKLIHMTGIDKMAERIGVPLVNMDKLPVVPLKSKQFPGLEISSILDEVDHLIGLVKLKTHTQMHYTCAVKHYFGMIPGERKQEWHFKVGTDYMAFARLLVEVCYLLNPCLTIVDGIMAMEGDGPGAGGTPRQLGAIFAGKSCPAIDTVVAEAIGANPDFSFTQKASRERFPEPEGILGIHLHNPDLLSKIKKTDWKFPEMTPMMIGPKPLRPLIRKYLTLYPGVDHKNCTLCLACQNLCPAQCIQKIDGQILIDRDTCIRCFCCVEVCPAGAIKSRAPLARKMITPLTRGHLSQHLVSTKNIESSGKPKLIDYPYYAYHIARANLDKHHRVPLSVYLFLTYRCTLNCTYCNVRNGGDRPSKMDTKSLIRLIDDMAHAGVRKIQFTGGEPLIRDDIGDIILYAKKKGMFVGISSNGDLVPLKIDVLKAADVVFISLDGPEKIHDAFRGRGSHRRAIEACHCLKNTGIAVWTTSVIHLKSIQHLGYPIELAEKNGWICNFQLLHARKLDTENHFKKKNTAQEILLTNAENRNALDFLIKEKKRGAPIGHSDKFLSTLRGWGDYTKLIKTGTKAKCWAGKLYAYIEPDGRMYPCGTQIHKGIPVNVLDPGGFFQAWKNLDYTYGCSQCLSGCQMEQNLMFSFDVSVLTNWFGVLKRSAKGRQ